MLFFAAWLIGGLLVGTNALGQWMYEEYPNVFDGSKTSWTPGYPVLGQKQQPNGMANATARDVEDLDGW